MILHAYFARRFLIAFMATFGILSAIFFLIEMVEQIRKFDTGAIGLVEIVKLTLLGAPKGIVGITPLITTIAALGMFLSLARSSELMVTRASGRYVFVTLSGPLFVAFLIGAFTFAVLNPIVASTGKRYEAVASRNAGGGSSALSISKEGLWFRQGGPDGQAVIHAARSNLDGTELFDVTFFGFDPAGVPSYRVEADSAKIGAGTWHLATAKKWPLDTSGNPERESTVHGELDIPTNLTVNQIRDSFGTPGSIPFWQLGGFIERLEKAGLSALRHRVWWNMELALPVMLVAMTLIGAGFSMRHTRLRRTGTTVLLALGLGLGFHFIRNFARILGENGQIPVLLAAWSPPVAAIMLTVGIILNLEDR